MTEISKKTLNALVDRSSKKKELASLLPRQKKESYPLFNQKELMASFFQLHDIHFSWFQKVLSSCSESEKAFFFGLFEQDQRTKLSSLMHFQGKSLTTASGIKKLAILQLKKRAMLIPTTPKQLLPENELNGLLNLSTPEIYELIDFLGIYDLSLYLKHVVSKTILSKIAASLTKRQVSHLQFVNKQPTKVVPQKLQLNEEQLDQATISRLIHKMGLYRLAGAIAYEPQEFLWHFLHQLDTGRAETLEKRMQTKDQELSKFFRKQVIMLIKRVKE